MNDQISQRASFTRYRCAYRIDTGSSFGTFEIEVAISDTDDYWGVAQAMFPHAALIDMNEVKR